MIVVCSCLFYLRSNIICVFCDNSVAFKKKKKERVNGTLILISVIGSYSLLFSPYFLKLLLPSHFYSHIMRSFFKECLHRATISLIFLKNRTYYFLSSKKHSRFQNGSKVKWKKFQSN